MNDSTGVQRSSSFTYPVQFSPKKNIFDSVEENDGKTSIDGRNVTSLRCADDIDALILKGQELEALVENLDRT